MARVTSETRNPLLWEEIDDPLVERVLSGPVEELAEATRPSFLNNPLSPLMWGDAAWDGLQANQVGPISCGGPSSHPLHSNALLKLISVISA